MTYPPGSPGYPPAQQPTNQFAAPTQQFGKVPDAAPAAEGPSKLPMYLTAAVAALGLAVYLSSYGPLFEASADFFTPTLLDLGVVASLLAALIAGVGLVPKQKTAPALVAVLSVLGFLLVIAIVLTDASGRQNRMGPLPDHRFQRGAGDRRRRGAAVRRGCHHAACAAAPLRAAAAVRSVRRSRTVLRTAPAARPAAPAGPAAPAAAWLSVAVRRWLPGWSVDGRILGGPAGRPSDAAHRLPHLQSAAVEQQCADDTGAGTAVVFQAVRPAAVVFHAVRPVAVVV